MKKRLRKKKHVGEFAEHGFLWEVKLREHPGEEAFMDLMSRFIDDWYDKRIWLGGGGKSGQSNYSPRMGGYCYATNARGKAFITLHQEDVEAIRLYFSQQPEVEAIVIGKLEDSHYQYNKHGHRVSKWKCWDDDKEWDRFHLEADTLLGPDGPRCCLGGYIWHSMNGEKGCSKCRKPYNSEVQLAL